jgi:hypothetical protein
MASVKELSGLRDVCKNKNNVRNIFPIITSMQVLPIPFFIHCQFLFIVSSYPLPALIHCHSYPLPVLIKFFFLSTTSSDLLPFIIYCQFLSTSSSYPLPILVHCQVLSTASSYPLPVLIVCQVLCTADSLPIQVPSTACYPQLPSPIICLILSTTCWDLEPSYQTFFTACSYPLSYPYLSLSILSILILDAEPIFIPPTVRR